MGNFHGTRSCRSCSSSSKVQGGSNAEAASSIRPIGAGRASGAAPRSAAGDDGCRVPGRNKGESYVFFRDGQGRDPLLVLVA
jgi:hypothetical protein